MNNNPNPVNFSSPKTLLNHLPPIRMITNNNVRVSNIWNGQHAVGGRQNKNKNKINPKRSSKNVKQTSSASPNETKRSRTRLSEEQLSLLRAHINLSASPSEEEYKRLSEESNLDLAVIKRWFRNTLFKERQRSRNSPYNFSVAPTTKLDMEEYTRTGTVRITRLSEEKSEKQYKNDLLSSSHSNNQSNLNSDFLTRVSPNFNYQVSANNFRLNPKLFWIQYCLMSNGPRLSDLAASMFQRNCSTLNINEHPICDYSRTEAESPDSPLDLSLSKK